ncbi:autotransporter outer membrane beta-barrel domain-containing protein [Stenotrophomonas rhizophila]|uniref:autotransporter outer membrane beta-barrel domain-containing protein n=1 Tax=Stenotrophomonas rhizophila TaxID=216778 RepID=UPI000C7EACDD|nr:autotransporter outer membrane beta-barrel domain-containing protein [Stenotrophomonas rhizophila]
MGRKEQTPTQRAAHFPRVKTRHLHGTSPSGLILLGVLATAPVTALAQSVDAATCITVPATVPPQQVRADGGTVAVAGGTYAPTVAGAPAFYAANGGVINASGAVALITSAANTATVCSTNGGAINFLAAGSTVSRLGPGGPAARVEAGTTLTSNGTRLYTSLANSEGIQVAGGSFIGTGDVIATGIVLGTQSGNPATYGLPVDAGGALVTDPSAYVGKAATAAHGISASDGTVRLNVDGAGNPTAGTTSIYILGTGAGAASGSHGLNGTSGARFTVHGVNVITRGNYNSGGRFASGAQLQASQLSIDTSGTGAVGLAFADAQGTVSGLTINATGIAAHGVSATAASQLQIDGLDVRVAGQNAHGVMASGGSTVVLGGTPGVVIAAGQTGHALRAEGAGSTLTADGLRISTLLNGAIGAHALDTGTLRLRGSQVFTSGIAGGNAAVGLQVASGGSLISQGNAILTGVQLGTDPASASYGLPVDAGGNVTTDPAAYVATGTTGANGAQVSASGGTLWLDVAADGTPLATATRIETFGNNSTGVLVAQSAAATSRLQAANTQIVTHGINANGVLVQGVAGVAGPQATLTQLDVRTTALNSNGVYGQAGAQVSIRDSALTTSGSGGGVRADGAATRITARNLYIGGGGSGGIGLNATGGTIDSAGLIIINAGRPAMTLNAGGGTAGTLISSGDTIYTGVLLGTDLALPTFGRPLDTSGTAITDPTAFVASGIAGHGVYVGTAGGRVWMNVDPATGQANGARNSITTLGDTSEGFNIQGVGAVATVANVTVATRGFDSIGARAAGAGEIRGTGLTVTTSGLHGYGLAAYADSLLTAQASAITTSGVQAHGLIAWADNGRLLLGGGSRVSTGGALAHAAVAWNGGRVEVDDSVLATTGVGAAALLVRGDPAAASALISRSSLVSADGPGVGAIGAAQVDLLGSTVQGRDLWLKVGAIADFDGLDAVVPVVPPDLPPDDPPVPLPQALAAPLPAAETPTVAAITATGSTLTGAAVTLPGSVSTVVLQDTLWNLTGTSTLTTLVNGASRIVFSPPGGDPALAASYKTLTVSRYGGDGTLAINTWLADDASPSDQLVVVDGSSSGPGLLDIHRSGGLGDLTVSDGIRVVQTLNATSTADNFRLAAPVVAGPYEYFLYRGGAASASGADVENSWYLRSVIDCAAPGAPTPRCPAPPPAPPPPDPPPPDPPMPAPPPTPAYRQEVSLVVALPAMAQAYGRSLLDTLHERVGDEQLLRQRDDLDSARSGFNGAWMRYVGHDGEHDGGRRGIYGDRGPDFDYRFDALQIGADLHRRIDADDLSRRHGGFYLAYGKGKGEVRHNFLDYRFHAGTDRFKAGSVGAYWTAFSAKGAYLDAVAQYTWYDMRLQSPRMPDSFLDADGLALSLEGGWPFILNEGDGARSEDGRWRLEPQAQVIWQQVDVDSLHDATAQVRFSDGDWLVGRVGARLSRNDLRVTEQGEARSSTGWLRGNVWHEFRGTPRATFASNSGTVPFAVDMGGSWAEIGIGGTWQLTQTGYLYADVDYSWSFDGDETAWNGKVGMRWNW